MTSFSTQETQEAMALNPDVLPSAGNHMAVASSRRAMHRALQTATSLQGPVPHAKGDLSLPGFYKYLNPRGRGLWERLVCTKLPLSGMQGF